MSTAHFTIHLPEFEGPFDLLLFFIERDELQIHDIPIALIAQEFLDHIHQWQVMNLEVAGEFILVAATLMRIKAKMLLPRREKDEAGNEIDPREELVQRLLAYQQFKAIAEELKLLESERQALHPRGSNSEDLRRAAEKSLSDTPLVPITPWRLLQAYQRVMARLEKQGLKHTVAPTAYTVDEQKNYVLKALAKSPRLNFDQLFKPITQRLQAICTFLAVLELAQSQTLHLQAGLDKNDFTISLI